MHNAQLFHGDSKLFTFQFSLFTFFRTVDYRRKYYRSRKPKKLLVFFSLIRTFAPDFEIN